MATVVQLVTGYGNFKQRDVMVIILAKQSARLSSKTLIVQ